MENNVLRKHTNKSGFNMGINGWLIVIMAFLSTFCYTALAGDSLNVTINVFGAMGLDTNIMYMMSTFGTLGGVVLTIACGKIITKRKIKNCWGILVLIGGAATLCWAYVHTTVIYCVVYLICFATTVTSSAFLATTLMANWFPRTRGVAIGIVTVSYPLSAAVTTSICTGYLQTALGITGYYLMMAVILIFVGIIVLAVFRDHPEEKGCYPDNDRFADLEQIRKEHEAAVEYSRTSKWTVMKVLSTRRFWMAVVSLVVGAFVCQGIMANFVNKFTEDGYQVPQILGMLTFAGLCAIPLSIFIGWLDLRIGTKKTGVLVNSFAVAGLICLLLPVHALNYVGLPLLAVLLGGSNNLSIAVFTAVWGRYDFANIYRVYTPIVNLSLGLGISSVGIIGTNISYQFAYVILLILSVISLFTMIGLKIKPIDEEVHM